MVNRLADSTSPYLRQHAGNPVDWRPWGSEAFEEAVRRDVPVFVSIGYAACHWCHVMAHESFEDEVTARELNARFVAVKVDREEHPDVDEAYMTATQLLTGQGGWPMSVFVTPDGRPFHAGTYYPPTPRQHGGARMPSFREVLDAVYAAWTGRREEVEQAAAALAAGVGRQSNALAAVVLGAGEDGTEPDAGPQPPATAVTAAIVRLAALEDPGHGGFGAAAPKFPPSPALGFLLQAAATGPRPVRATAWALASRTLAVMGTSSLADPVSGGFARYATDRSWALPHFEKMLYDNAQLLRWYARWAVLADHLDHLEHLEHLAPLDPRHPGLARRLALGTAAWLAEQMTTSSGGFAASLDADTVVDGHPVEGATYTWTPTELREALAAGAPDADPAEVEHLAEVLAGVPVEPGTAPLTLHAGRLLTGEGQALWDRALPGLRHRAASRPQPARDGKEVAAWNGMAVTALAEAWALLGEERLLEQALAAGDALWRVHCRPAEGVPAPGGGAGAPTRPASVLRSALEGRPGPAAGTLADHAQVAGAFIALYRSTGQARWKARARAVVDAVVGTLVVQTDHGPALLAAPAGDAVLAAAQGGPGFASPLDGAEPSAIGAWAEVLLQWHVLVPVHAGTLPGGGALAWAERLLGHVDRLAERAPLETSTALRLAARHGAVEDLLVAAGGTAEDRRQALAWAIVRGVVGVPAPPETVAGAGSADGFRPDDCALTGPGDVADPDVADPDDVTAGRTSRDGATSLYLCHGTLCHAPVDGTEALDRLARDE